MDFYGLKQVGRLWSWNWLKPKGRYIEHKLIKRSCSFHDENYECTLVVLVFVDNILVASKIVSSVTKPKCQIVEFWNKRYRNSEPLLGFRDGEK